MRLKTKLTGKRRELLARWLQVAMAASTDPTNPECFDGFSASDSKEVKEVLDDIYTDCISGEAQ